MSLTTTATAATPAPSPGDKPKHRRFLRRALKSTAALVALLAIAYGALCIWYYSQSPKLTRNFTAELNAPTLKIPPEKRAWTHYRRALEVLEPPNENEMAETPGDSNWTPTAAYLKRNAKAIGLIRAAASMRPLGVTLEPGVDPNEKAWRTRHGVRSDDDAQGIPRPGENPALFALVFHNELTYLVQIARVLQADARLAASDNDSQRMVANLNAMLDVGEQVLDYPFIVSQLVGITIEGLGVRAMGTILADSPTLFDDEALVRFSSRLQAVAAKRSFSFRMQGERMFYADLLQRLYTDCGDSDGSFTIDGGFEEFNRHFDILHESTLLGRVRACWDRLRVPIWAAFVMPNRRDLEESNERYLDDVDRILALPHWQRAANMVGFVDKMPFDAALHAWDPSSLNVYDAVHSLQVVDAEFYQDVGGVLVAIALARHHRVHRKWPAKLADLVLGTLPDVPPDQFTGQPLRYKLVDGKPMVYSVGADLDDDGGEPPTEADAPLGSEVRSFDNDRPPNGDWILWPPPKEEPDEVEPDANAADEPPGNAEPNANAPDITHPDPPINERTPES